MGHVRIEPDGGAPIPGVEENVPDTYHNHENLVTLSLRINAFSWVFVALACVAVLGAIGVLLSVLPSMQISESPLSAVPVLFAYLSSPLETVAVSLAVFLLLRAASEGLLLLMDVEDNTRKKG
jgi:hypothetical protein